MEHRIMAKLALIALLISVASAASSPPYTNHTVGGSAGWFFNLTTNSSSTNFSTWAASQTFNLGDYLIFNTTTNQTVIQTYNQTIYNICDYDDDESDNDTSVYSGGNRIGEPVMISVPLTIEGPNYYFSDADDGVQCLNGMKFGIAVGHGRGLPPSLNQPPPPPYQEPSPDSSSPPATGNQGQNTNNPTPNGCSRSASAATFLAFLVSLISTILL